MVDFWANTVTDVATDVVEGSKKSAEVELVKRHLIRDAEAQSRYHESVAHLYPGFHDLFQETVALLK